METRSAYGRILLCLKHLDIPASTEAIEEILLSLGFKKLSLCPVSIARQYIGKAAYKRGATLLDAPDTFDCSSLMKYAWGQCGLWIPRYSIDQRSFSTRIEPTNTQCGDLIFTTGYRNYFWNDPNDEVGHVGLITEKNTVIHAANKCVGIIETPLKKFCDNDHTFRGICRLVDRSLPWATWQTPPKLEIETSTQVRWKILQNLGKPTPG